MNLDDLILLALNVVFALFFVLAPLMLARTWMPAATRLAERIAVPVLLGIAVLALIGTAVPYVLVLLLTLMGIAVPLGVYWLIVQRHGQRRPGRGRSRHGRQAWRYHVVRRPPGRPRHHARRRN